MSFLLSHYNICNTGCLKVILQERKISRSYVYNKSSNGPMNYPRMWVVYFDALYGHSWCCQEKFEGLTLVWLFHTKHKLIINTCNRFNTNKFAPNNPKDPKKTLTKLLSHFLWQDFLNLVVCLIIITWIMEAQKLWNNIERFIHHYFLWLQCPTWWIWELDRLLFSVSQYPLALISPLILWFFLFPLFAFLACLLMGAHPYL